MDHKAASGEDRPVKKKAPRRKKKVVREETGLLDLDGAEEWRDEEETAVPPVIKSADILSSGDAEAFNPDEEEIFDDSFFDEEEEKGIKGFFKKKISKAQTLKLRYSKIEGNIDEICEKLEGHQVQLLKDSAMLDQLYELNKVYFRELTMYILAGKKKLEEEENEVIPALRKKAELSGRQEDAQEVNDREALCNRFDKKIHDLELTRMVSLQMAPQIRMVQASDITMSEKIQSTLVNTIPLWKSQMIIALGVEHSREAAEAQRKVTDLTNDLLKKNAEKLKTATIETAKESERGIIDMETLVATNESLMSTIDEVMKIQQEGREKRREAEGKLVELEDELKQKLLSQSK